MMTHELVHDNMRSGTSVKNVADNVQMVDNKSSDQVANCHNEFRSPVDFDYRVNNFVIICFLILDFFLFGNKFFNNIGKVFRECLSDFRPCVLGSYSLSNLDESVKSDFVPVVNVISSFSSG